MRLFRPLETGPFFRPMGPVMRMAFLIMAIATTPALALAGAQDVATLGSRLRTEVLSSESTSAAANALSTQQSIGCWSDINYADTSRTNWAPTTHLLRLLSMAVAYQTPTHAQYHSAQMLAGIVKGIDCWKAKAPTSDNWWYNDIGKQKRLGPIGLLMDADLDQPHRKAVIDELPTVPSMTGQNRVDISIGVIYRGFMEKDEPRIKTGLGGITETIVVTSNEGIQRDGSFHQHGPQLYNSGYGLSFVQETSYWANITRETVFAFDQSLVDTLTMLILDGDRWMIRGKQFDYGADGRGISRGGSRALWMRGMCDRFLLLDTPRAGELQALCDHLNGGPAPLTGNRHFWRSDFMAHQRPSFYASVKMCSERTNGTECMNAENLLGYWLPFGITYLAQRGDEYLDVFPVWDWTLLPGVTAPDHLPSFTG